MTDTAVPITDDARARVEQLRRNRQPGAAAGGRPVPKHHPARGTKIAAAGFGLATMLGLVGAMGYTNRPANAAQPAAQPAAALTAPPPIVVVIHRNQQVAGSATGVPQLPAAPAGASTAVAVSAPAAPIALTAQPVVKQAPAAQAPTAATHGSR